MTIDEAETEEDFIEAYVKVFGETPVVSGGKGYPIIDQIIVAISDGIPINEQMPPDTALL
jgi:hypothetical protein